jgi:WD40 repeat protein
LPSIPGYELLESIGQGGMGRVFKARQLATNRLVAVKLLLAGEYAGGTTRERFRVEIEATARLSHPHIVQVFEAGEVDGREFLTCEYMAGGSLAARLDGTPWDAPRAARLLVSVTSGVAAAHSAGIIHRDLKPSNILLTQDGTPKVADFGVAKRLDEHDNSPTHTGAILGTPSYMAPEQVGGAKSAGPAADVYSLGAALYELLTGRPPFKGADVVETLDLVRSQEAITPRAFQPRIPRDLETICLKCLQKEPPRRYPSAEALAADLERFLAGQPIAARPVGGFERGWRWCRRNPAVAGLLAMLALVLVAVAAIATGAAIRFRTLADQERIALEGETQQRREAETARAEAEAARHEAERLHLQAETARAAEEDQRKRVDGLLKQERTNLYFSRITLAHREWLANDVPAATRLLEECPTDLRGWEWHYVNRVCHSEQFLLRHIPNMGRRSFALNRTNAAFSPDGRWIASGSNHFVVKLWDAATGEEALMLRGHGGPVNLVAFGPDSRRLASTGLDRMVRIWELPSGRLLKSLPGLPGYVAGLAFSVDGSRLAAAGPNHTVRIWDATTGAELGDFRDRTLGGFGYGSSDTSRVAFSPDGTRIASAAGHSATRNDEVLIYDVAEKTVTMRLQGHAGDVPAVAYSPDGQFLVTGSADRTLRRWDAKTGQQLLVFRGHGGAVHDVAYSPDGRRIASASSDRSAKVWDAISGEELFTLRGHTSDLYSVAFSHDGTRLVSLSGLADNPEVKVWNLAVGQEAHVIPDHLGKVRGVAVSPDGRLVASAAFQKGTKLWDARTGRLVHELDRQYMDSAVAFSPDGTLVAAGGTHDSYQQAKPAIRVWEAESGREVLALKGLKGEVKCLAFTPDGKWLVSGGGKIPLNGFGEIKVWDVATGREALSVAGHDSEVNGLAISPDGKLLATAAEYPSVIKVWSLVDGKEVRALRGHRSAVHGLAFRPDGRSLASAGQDHTVRLWDVAGAAEPIILRGHTQVVGGVAYSPDGTRLATAGWDKTVRIWDVGNRQEAITLRGHTDSVEAVAFGPNGHVLVSGGWDGTVRLWNASLLPAQLEDPATAKARLAIDTLLADGTLAGDLPEHIRSNRSLDGSGVQAALKFAAQVRGESPAHLNNRSWEVVKRSGAEPAAYDRALRLAVILCDIEPNNAAYLNTLGVAQYRTGRYREAVQTLTRADELNRSPAKSSDPFERQGAGSIPADLAFLAMAHFQLGEKDKALDLLKRLRELMKKPPWSEDAEAADFLKEAELLIEPEAHGKRRSSSVMGFLTPRVNAS